jgi:hypothetical protein|tara:strand:+ start:2180 stop:2470 length:291 start_codon:yes stop_codon:yes gene_type:complete
MQVNSDSTTLQKNILICTSGPLTLRYEKLIAQLNEDKWSSKHRLRSKVPLAGQGQQSEMSRQIMKVQMQLLMFVRRQLGKVWNLLRASMSVIAELG